MWREQCGSKLDKWPPRSGPKASGENWPNSENTTLMVEKEDCVSTRFISVLSFFALSFRYTMLLHMYMYIYMYICIYIYTYMYPLIFLFIHSYIGLDTNVFTFKDTRLHAHSHTPLQTHTHIDINRLPLKHTYVVGCTLTRSKVQCQDHSQDQCSNPVSQLVCQL